MYYRCVSIPVLILFLVITACGDDHRQDGKKRKAVTTRMQQIPDTILFTYQADIYAETLTLCRNGDLYFEEIRCDRPISDKRIRVNMENGKKMLDSLFESVPVSFQNNADAIKIGAPNEYDQGEYFLMLIFPGKPASIINIDPDHKRWPKEDTVFLNGLEKLYDEVRLQQDKDVSVELGHGIRLQVTGTMKIFQIKILY